MSTPANDRPIKSHEDIMEMDRQQMIHEDIKRRALARFDPAMIADKLIAKGKEAAKK